MTDEEFELVANAFRIGNLPLAEALPFLLAMRDAPGEVTNLLVFADWLDEQGASKMAAALRRNAPKCGRYFANAVRCRDALLALKLDSVRPYPVRPSSSVHGHTRDEIVATVRDAVKTLKLPDVTVAAAEWGRSANVRVACPVPFYVCTDRAEHLMLVPWDQDRPEPLAHLAWRTFREVMPRLFPSGFQLYEPHDFWGVGTRVLECGRPYPRR